MVKGTLNQRHGENRRTNMDAHAVSETPTKATCSIPAYNGHNASRHLSRFRSCVLNLLRVGNCWRSDFSVLEVRVEVSSWVKICRDARVCSQLW